MSETLGSAIYDRKFRSGRRAALGSRLQYVQDVSHGTSARMWWVGCNHVSVISSANVSAEGNQEKTDYLKATVGPSTCGVRKCNGSLRFCNSL